MNSWYLTSLVTSHFYKIRRRITFVILFQIIDEDFSSATGFWKNENWNRFYKVFPGLRLLQIASSHLGLRVHWYHPFWLYSSTAMVKSQSAMLHQVNALKLSEREILFAGLPNPLTKKNLLWYDKCVGRPFQAARFLRGGIHRSASQPPTFFLFPW